MTRPLLNSVQPRRTLLLKTTTRLCFEKAVAQLYQFRSRYGHRLSDHSRSRNFSTIFEANSFVNMSDDQGMMGDPSTGMLNDIDEFDFQGLDNDNHTLNNIYTASMTDEVGSRPLLMPTSSWTQSMSLGTNDMLVDGQMQAPRYLKFNGINSSDFNGAPDDATEYPALGNYGSTTSRICDRPTMATNNSFLSDSAQDFNSINPILGLAGSYNASMTYATPQNFDASALKKRKASAVLESKDPAKDGKVFDSFAVLNLLFKYTPDLTMTQMLNIAEDTGCKPEHVVSSYYHYRTSGSVLLNHIPSTDHSALASLKHSNGSIKVGVANGGESEDSMANNDASRDVRQENGKGECVPGTLVHAAQEKRFQCSAPDCDARFSRPAELKRHAKKHQPPEFPCTFPSCDEMFYRKDKLRQHWEKKHGNSSRPSDLGSNRPKGDPDQDGDSRSNGFSRGANSRMGEPSSNKFSTAQNSTKPGSPADGCASDGHQRFSGGAEGPDNFMEDSPDQDRAPNSVPSKYKGAQYKHEKEASGALEMPKEKLAPVAIRGEEATTVIAREIATKIQIDQLIINLLDVQLPLPGPEWLKDFERPPDVPLKKSYQPGILLAKVDTSAPVIKVGITFLAGTDKLFAIRLEMSKVSDGEPSQKSPEWRVYTAATLLNRFDIGDNLLFHHKDDTAAIVQRSKQRKRQRIGKSPEKYHATFQNWPGKQQAAIQGGEENQEIVERNIQDHTLTIDSDEVKLLHGIAGVDQYFDITCTLIEIDLFSMRDLMMNFRTIVQSGGRNVSAKDIIAILDTMINDVRRFYTRSPRFFRMSTRSLIAHSIDTRFGVEYGTNFATLTTSTGIRKLIDMSSEYYLSLNDSTIDQEYIRPKFLQILVLLLSFLNNEDLQKIANVLESIFHIPGDRANLELLIMKVLPLASVNSEVFLEGLYDAYKPVEERKNNYGHSLQAKIWEELQQDLAAKGYIIPVHIESSRPGGLNSASLENALSRMDLEDPEPSPWGLRGQRRLEPQRTGSWRVPWPRDGLIVSTIFKHLQHDGLLRDKGDSKHGTYRAMNDIPRLEITPEDHDDKLDAWFTNGKQYRLEAGVLDLISDMKEGTYVLSSLDNDTSANLEIASRMLNKPFIDATKKLNILVQKIKGDFDGRVHKQGAFPNLLRNNSPSVILAAVDEPIEAKWLWAEVISPTGDRQRVAEVFKMGNKVVYRDDILRDMNCSLSKLDMAVGRLEKELGKLILKKPTSEDSRRQQQEVDRCGAVIGVIKQLMREAEKKGSELLTIRWQYPEDPIARVIYPSFSQTNGEKRQWQNYQIQLWKDGQRLSVKSKKLVVESAVSGQDHVVELGFVDSNLKLSVEPLASSRASDTGPSLGQGDTLLWMGYYVVLVEPVESVRRGQIVLGYFRVRSQRVESNPEGGGSGELNLKDVISVLV